MRIISFGNMKGGVSKTTNTLNCAFALANTYNKRVLVIDFDGQYNATQNLNIDSYAEGCVTIDEILEPYVKNPTQGFDLALIQKAIISPVYTGRERDPENKMRFIDVEKEFGFDIIPSNYNLSILETIMAQSTDVGKGYPYYLRDLLRFIGDHFDYDYVLIDTPPSLGMLSLSAIAAAKDGVIAATNLDLNGYQGILPYIENTEWFQEQYKRRNEVHRGILGILIVRFSGFRKIDQTLEEYGKKFTPYELFETTIPETSDARKATAVGMLVSQINKKIKTAYDDVAGEIIDLVEHDGAKHKAHKEANNGGSQD